MENQSNSSVVYISYARGSESEAIIEKIENEFQKNRIVTIRDKKNLLYKGSISDFMTELGKGKYIVLVLNNKYFQSKYCMFELIQIFKNNQFQDRIFPIVLDDLDIYKAEDRVKLIKYWERQTAGLESEIRDLQELSNIQGVSKELDLYAEIRNTIANLTSKISDINTLSLEQHLKSGFDDLMLRVKEKIKLDNQSHDDVRRSGKKRFHVVRMIAYALPVGMVGVWLIFQFGRNTPEEPTNSEIAGESHQAIITDSSGSVMSDTEVAITEPESDITNNPEPAFYRVQLIVPSNMLQGTIMVDGKPAVIVSRSLTFITVRVDKKSDSHNFVIESGSATCATDQLISANDITVTLCD